MVRFLLNIIFVIFALLSLKSPGAAADCPSLDIEVVASQMAVLDKEIRHHNYLYYQKNSPEITDSEYDCLFSELLLLEKCFPELVSADSPTGRVGVGSVAGKSLLRHDMPMLSLNSSTGSDAVEVLLRRALSAEGVAVLLVQPKVDGLPVELVYVEGMLFSAATRGDGQSGEPVTDRVRRIEGIPQLLNGDFPSRLVVRGEIYADAQAAATAGGKTAQYATLRHLAAGTLLSGDADPSSLATLRFFPFELVNATRCCAILSDRDALARLAGWGFPVKPEDSHSVSNLNDVREVYRCYLAGRSKQPFAMDGIVVKVDDLALRERMGVGSRAPLWSAAWKFPPVTARTTVRKIIWQTGRSGRRTPVAVVEPVTLGGIVVRRVSLHNRATVERMGIRAGDQVVVALVGDVIAQIVEVPEHSGSESVPEEVSGIMKVDPCFSDSPVCRDRFLARAAHFTSKAGLDIAGLGRGRLKLLVEAGLVHDLPSIIRLSSREAAMASLLGTKTAAAVVGSIISRRSPQLSRAIAAVGISGVGQVAAQRLALGFHSLAELLAADEKQISALPKIPQKTAHSVRKFFSAAEGRKLLQEFRELGVW